MNHITIVVVNDGNGSQCGYSYETRLKFARENTLANASKWCTMAKNTAIKLQPTNATDKQTNPRKVLESSIELYNYYQAHIKTLESIK
jgi:hypothetical protein